MWICPKCNRPFRNTNQAHSCVKIAATDLFKGKPDIIKETYDKLVEVVNKIGEVKVTAVKSAIFFKTKSTYIEIKPRKEYLFIAFYLDKEVKEFPISRTLQLSKNRVVHVVHLGTPSDINKQLIDWLKQSYKLISN